MPPLYNPEIDALLELIQATGQMPSGNQPANLAPAPATSGSPNTYRIGQGPVQTLDERPIGSSYSESFPGGGSFTTLPAGQAGAFGGPEGILRINQPDPQLVAQGRARQDQERFQDFLRSPQGQLLMQNIGKLDPSIQAEIVGRLSGGTIRTRPQAKGMEEFQAKELFKSGLRRGEKAEQKAARTVADDRGFHYLDPNTGEPLAPDTTILEANKIKAKRVNNQQFQTAQSALNGLQLLNQFENLSHRLPFPKETGVLGKTGGGLSIKLLRAQGDPLAAELDALSTSITQLAVAFGGDRRITKEERALLFQAVPKDFETLPSALQRISTTRKNLLAIAKRLDIPVPQELREGETKEGVSVPVGKQPTGGKLATQADVGKAMTQARGNKQQALQILKQQGFTGAQ